MSTTSTTVTGDPVHPAVPATSAIQLAATGTRPAMPSQASSEYAPKPVIANPTAATP